jgi:hypothetical protein
VISGRTACDYVDMFADFVKGCGLSPKELVRLTPNEAFSVLKNFHLKLWFFNNIR